MVKIADGFYQKSCRHGGGGCQKSRKIADVVYGWSLAWLAFQIVRASTKSLSHARVIDILGYIILRGS